MAEEHHVCYGQLPCGRVGFLLPSGCVCIWPGLDREERDDAFRITGMSVSILRMIATLRKRRVGPLEGMPRSDCRKGRKNRISTALNFKAGFAI